MVNQTYPIGSEHSTQEIDDAILTDEQMLIDEWLGEYGVRLYRFETDIPDVQPVFVGTVYEKEIDEETGETVEETEIKAVGQASVEVSIRESEVREHFQDDDVEAPEPRDIPTLLHLLENEMSELLNTAPREDIRISPGSKLRIRAGEDPDTISSELAQKYRSSGPESIYWLVFLEDGLDNMMSVTEVTARPRVKGPDEFDGDMYYSPTQVSFESVPEWVLRYIENRYCGWYPSKQMAAIDAMEKDDTIESQAEMAEILDVSESAVSQRKSKLEEFKESVSWMCNSMIKHMSPV
jgi:hypothetical protein